MNTICQDVFNNISNYLSIIDIAKLKRTNKLTRSFVNNFEEIYLTNELNKNKCNISIIEKKKIFYTCFVDILFKFYINDYNFKNKILDDMILDIYYYYINKQYVKFHPNILNLITINSFFNIIFNPSRIEIKSGLNFLKNFNKPSLFLKFQGIIINYYMYILNFIHEGNLVHNAFEVIYDMSPYVINIYCLKKIFSYRILDLSKTDILFCCNLDNCVVNNLHEICDIKYAYYNDDLISYNYIEIKSFLYKRCIEYYNILIERENYLLNKKLFIKNPMSNRRMRVNGKQWLHLISFLKKRNTNIYNDIISDVLTQQNILRNKIFGKFTINN